MERKVFIEAKVKLVLRMSEGKEVGEALSELQPPEGGDCNVQVEDFEVLDHEVTDSK